MKWLIIIIAAIVLLYVRSLLNKRIDGSENKKAIKNELSLWDGLCLKFRRYLDFTQRTMLPDRMEIANQKGEIFTFQKVVTDIVVSYKIKGKVEKTWQFPFWVSVNVAFNNIDEYYRAELQPKASTKHISTDWIITSSRPFTDEEIMAVSSNRVVKSQYGLSVEFTMKKGGVIYIPMYGCNEDLVGVEIDLHIAEIFTLSKEGENNIYRIDYLPY